MHAKGDVGRAADRAMHLRLYGGDIRLRAETKSDGRRVKRRLPATVMAGDQQQVGAVENVAKLHLTHPHNTPLSWRLSPVEKILHRQFAKSESEVRALRVRAGAAWTRIAREGCVSGKSPHSVRTSMYDIL